MKIFYKSVLTMAFMLFAMVANVAASAAPEEIVLDVVDPDVSASEVWNIYENEDYKLYIDIIKNLPLSAETTYTLEDLDLGYSYIYSKNEVITNQFGTKNWKKYELTSASIKIGENNVLEADIEAANGEDVIKAKFIYTNPEAITFTLTGECEYLADMNVYSFSAKNKGSELKADYTISLGIKGEAFAKGEIGADDLTAYGNSIRVATVETKIANVNLKVVNMGDTQKLTGIVIGSNDKTYSIELTTNVPSTEGGDVIEDTIGAVLEVSEDEGDIKFVAENGKTKFVGYISGTTTDVPTGSYDLLSYSKYGANSDFGYMLDAIEDAHVSVVNEDGVITITASFKQYGKTYAVVASTKPAAEPSAEVTIANNGETITVTSTTNDACHYIFKPVDWYEGEAPEDCLKNDIEEMGYMIDSEDTWELYDHMGLQPAPISFNIANYAENYAGQKMILVAANVGWTSEGLAVISNIATYEITIPTADGINDATVAAAKAGKFIENGKLVIVKAGKKYGVNAVEVK